MSHIVFSSKTYFAESRPFTGGFLFDLMQQNRIFVRLVHISGIYIIFDFNNNLFQTTLMKKTFFLLSSVILSMILFSCCKGGQEQVSLFYKEVIYDFSDNVDYFTATLVSCSGVKDINDPSKGTLYATINIKANRLCNVIFSSTEGLIDDTYVTEYSVYPMEYYPAVPFSREFSLSKDQTVVLNLVFPNVPARLLKVGRMRVAALISNFKNYAFTIHQIPYKPDTDRIVWN